MFYQRIKTIIVVFATKTFSFATIFAVCWEVFCKILKEPCFLLNCLKFKTILNVFYSDGYLTVLYRNGTGFYAWWRGKSVARLILNPIHYDINIISLCPIWNNWQLLDNPILINLDIKKKYIIIIWKIGIISCFYFRPLQNAKNVILNGVKNLVSYQ